MTTTRAAAHTLLAGMFTIAAWLPSIHQAAPEAGWQGQDARPSLPALNVPTWTREAARAFPDCHAAQGRADGLADRVVVRLSGELERVSFDLVAKAAASDHDGLQVWVVGACPES